MRHRTICGAVLEAVLQLDRLDADPDMRAALLRYGRMRGIRDAKHVAGIWRPYLRGPASDAPLAVRELHREVRLELRRRGLL